MLLAVVVHRLQSWGELLLPFIGSLCSSFWDYGLSPHRGGIEVRSSSDLLSPVNEVHSVFSNETTNERQPMATAIVYLYSSGSLLDSPDKQLEVEHFSCLELGFY